MTVQQKNNLGVYFTVANFLVILGFVWHQSKWQQKVDSRMEVFEKHVEDRILHMPFEKTIEVFVPRVEMEGKMNNMQYSLDKIERKLDNMKK